MIHNKGNGTPQEPAQGKRALQGLVLAVPSLLLGAKSGRLQVHRQP